MSATTKPSNVQPEDTLVQAILDAIRSIRFGSVLIIVQDSKVVQIDKTEKVRVV